MAADKPERAHHVLEHGGFPPTRPEVNSHYTAGRGCHARQPGISARRVTPTIMASGVDIFSQSQPTGGRLQSAIAMAVPPTHPTPRVRRAHDPCRMREWSVEWTEAIIPAVPTQRTSKKSLGRVDLEPPAGSSRPRQRLARPPPEVSLSVPLALGTDDAANPFPELDLPAIRGTDPVYTRARDASAPRPRPLPGYPPRRVPFHRGQILFRGIERHLNE